MSTSSYDLSPNLIQIDNYVITSSLYSNKQRYKIDWRDDNIDKLEPVISDFQKLMVVRSILLLMNEVDIKLLNIINYKMLADYEHSFNLIIQQQPK